MREATLCIRFVFESLAMIDSRNVRMNLDLKKKIKIGGGNFRPLSFATRRSAQL
jgi:hypothetical protein